MLHPVCQHPLVTATTSWGVWLLNQSCQPWSISSHMCVCVWVRVKSSVMRLINMTQLTRKFLRGYTEFGKRSLKEKRDWSARGCNFDLCPLYLLAHSFGRLLTHSLTFSFSLYLTPLHLFFFFFPILWPTSISTYRESQSEWWSSKLIIIATPGLRETSRNFP